MGYKNLLAFQRFGNWRMRKVHRAEIVPQSSMRKACSLIWRLGGCLDERVHALDNRDDLYLQLYYLSRTL